MILSSRIVRGPAEIGNEHGSLSGFACPLLVPRRLLGYFFWSSRLTTSRWCPAVLSYPGHYALISHDRSYTHISPLLRYLLLCPLIQRIRWQLTNNLLKHRPLPSSRFTLARADNLSTNKEYRHQIKAHSVPRPQPDIHLTTWHTARNRAETCSCTAAPSISTPRCAASPKS